MQSDPDDRAHPDALLVCADQRWLVEELRAGAAGRWATVPVGTHRRPDVAALVAEHGPVTAWWSTTGHAARLLEAGLPLRLAACPPWFVGTIDEALVGRHVSQATLGQLASSTLRGRGFVKPSTAKLDHLHAGVVDDLAAAAGAALDAGVPAAASVDFTTDVVEFVAEHRLFVVDGVPVTSSAYRLGGDTWDDRFDDRPAADPSAALAWATPVVAQLHAEGRTPPAWVCDVGRLPSGRHVVVEANAAWSSGTYGCDLRAVADAVAAATVGGHAPVFDWAPDPAEVDWARRHPLR